MKHYLDTGKHSSRKIKPQMLLEKKGFNEWQILVQQQAERLVET